MAEQDFWRGFNTAVLMSAVLALCCLVNIYLCGIVVAIVVFALLHTFLAGVRNHLRQQQELRKVKAIATALYSDHGKLSIRFLEIHQHVGVRRIKIDWVAGVGSEGTVKGEIMLVKTDTRSMTKSQALGKLHKILAKELMKHAADMLSRQRGLGERVG